MTPLARNLLAAFVCPLIFLSIGIINSFLHVVIALGIAIAGAVLSLPPPKSSSTALDCFLMNLDDILEDCYGNTIAVVMRTEKVPSQRDVMKMAKQLVAQYDRFSSIVVKESPCLDSTWKKVAVDLKSHIGASRQASHEQEMKDAIEAVINLPLPFSRPLWHIECIDSTNGMPAAVVFRVSHALGDGLRLVRAASLFVRDEAGQPAELPLLKRISKMKAAMPSPLQSLGQALGDFKTALTADQLPDETGTCLHPTKTVFRKSEHRSIASCEIDFSRVKEIKATCPSGSTINDVILCAFCGAIYRYLEKEQDPSLKAPSGPLLRAFCAFSLPDLKGRDEGPDSLYNYFVMPTMDLCVQKDREVRLATMSSVMSKMKKSFVGSITLAITALLTQLGLEKFVGETQQKVFSNHSFVYSNVPAFETQVFAFGQALTSVYAYYPNLINQVIFLSCNGKLTLSFITETSVVKDPQFFVDSFVAEIDEWYESLGQ